MKELRLVFMGTPVFALPALRALHRGPHRIILVVTQPDRPAGRGRQVCFSPVKEAALSLGLTVWQPSSLRGEDSRAVLRAAAPDLIVTAAYGKLLPSPILELPSLGCINLHASLLPAYRGAAPIHRAVMEGAAASGVTVMRMTAELDTGEIILQERLPVGPEETAGGLHDRLAAAGGPLLARAVAELAAGTAVFTPQDPALASYAPPLQPEDERLDWSLDSASIYNRIRGMAPWPGAYTAWRGRRLKVLRAEPPGAQAAFAAAAPGTPPVYSCAGLRDLPGPAESAPGTVCRVEGAVITVTTGDGILGLSVVQPEGKRPMEAGAFARGRNIGPGSLFT